MAISHICFSSHKLQPSVSVHRHLRTHVYVCACASAAGKKANMWEQCTGAIRQYCALTVSRRAERLSPSRHSRTIAPFIGYTTLTNNIIIKLHGRNKRPLMQLNALETQLTLSCMHRVLSTTAERSCHTSWSTWCFKCILKTQSNESYTVLYFYQTVHL